VNLDRPLGVAPGEVVAALESGAAVHRELPGGHLDIERPLPILLVHRSLRDDQVAPQLLQGHSAIFIVSQEVGASEIAKLLRPIIRVQVDQFGAFLMIELWESAALQDEPGLAFRVVTAASEEVRQPANVLSEALHKVYPETSRPRAVIDHGVVAPPAQEQLLNEDDLRELGCLLLGLEVPAVYRGDAEGLVYPRSLRVLRTCLSRAIQETFFEFIRVHTSYELKDHRELGRRTLVPSGTEIDKRLAAFGAGLDFLLHITPVNTTAAFEEFVASRYDHEPSFHYRLLPFDPDLLKRELYQLPIEEVSDPTLQSLMREKRVELDRMVTLLEDRDTPRFLPGTMQVYPAVDDRLLAEAEMILSKVPPMQAGRAWVTPQEFAARAERELDLYSDRANGLQRTVNLRDDMPGIMVSHGRLHLNATTLIGQDRVEPLIQHEVGTHIVTYENGLAQPLMLMSAGLPGYEQTQEGLAMLAEYACGGLGPDRLRLIAARVVAVDMVTKGATFVEIYRRMHRDLELRAEAAWSVTMRACRGGGSTKDAIYLRGLIAILDHIGSNHELAPLLTGKIALEHVPLIEELLWRQILKPPRLRPRWLDMAGAAERLQKVKEGMSVIDLTEH
jgi:uncharacterized protein (TIGR02421 family)